MRTAILALVLAAGTALACSDSPPAAESRSDPAPKSAIEPTAATSPPAAKKASSPPAQKRTRHERPLPAFSGFTIDDQKLEIAKLIGKRMLLFFFNPEVSQAPTAATAVGQISPLRGKQNFEIVGIATGSNRRTILEFAKVHGIDYPVVDDSSAAIANQLGLRQPMAFFGVDTEGYVTFGVPGPASAGPEATRALEGQIRDAMRLPPLSTGSEPVLGTRPVAPSFKARRLEGEEPFDLSAHRGEALIVMFFLHTCPHCHETLAFFREELPKLPEGQRPRLVGIEITGRTGEVRRELKTRNLDFFEVLFDDDGSIQSDYGVFAGVPDTFFLDANGRIAARVKGWRVEQDAPLARMRMAKLAGAPVPMLLRKEGYSGSAACGICHENEMETWEFTRHARAFDTLVKHGESSNGECVSCHVVGYDQPGGFTASSETAELEDVGCESCHGRGGPHLSTEYAKRTDYSPSCQGCHDDKHSLGFEYATFLPKVSHTANAHLLTLSVEEKQARLEALGVPRDVLASDMRYVGSDACRSCHESEYATWAASPHAHAVDNLKKADKADDASCLKCHTTAFGRNGGFAPTSAAEGDLARVGCESCHGPGEAHIAEGAVRLGTIVSLQDKCDSCVILQICGACHDDANDPGFEFEVQEKIEAQRHGTIEAGTGKPLGPSARSFTPLRVAATAPRHGGSLERAFDAAARSMTWIRP